MPPIVVDGVELCDIGDIYVGDTPVKEVYVGSTKVFPCGPIGETGLCFTFDESKICLPMPPEFVGGVDNGAWYFEVEFNLQDASVAAVQGLFQTEPRTELNNILDLAFAKEGIGANTWKVGMAGTYGSNFGSVYTVDPGFDEWYRVRLGYDGANDFINLVVTRLATGDQDDLLSSVGGKPSEFLRTRDNICLGVMQNQNEILATGQFRNAKLVQNGLTLGDWPIQDYMEEDGTVLDISGNGNNGMVTSIGNGSISECTP